MKVLVTALSENALDQVVPQACHFRKGSEIGRRSGCGDGPLLDLASWAWPSSAVSVTKVGNVTLAFVAGALLASGLWLLVPACVEARRDRRDRSLHRLDGGVSEEVADWLRRQDR